MRQRLRGLTHLCASGLFLCVGLGSAHAKSNPASFDPHAPKPPTIGSTVQVHGLEWDVHEVTIGQVKTMAAATGFISRAEKEGGGFIYEMGWSKKAGWNWRRPYGIPGADAEPAVHLTFDEAQSVCGFFGKRLPTDKEWTQAAYLEDRLVTPKGYVRGQRYEYPSGTSPKGSHCLTGCGLYRGVAPAGSIDRGTGHVPALTTLPGVNGLYDMGANVWEWVDTGLLDERITRGGSWWYRADRQREADVATKPKDTRVAYIGFRCVR